MYRPEEGRQILPGLAQDGTTSQDKAAHVLLVDDDELLRDLVTSYLEAHGFRVTPAADGRAMREVLARAPVDLILLDLTLPGEDGFTLAREVRSMSRTPIVIISANSDVIDRVAGLEAGADDYVAKPLHLREVLARVRAVLRRADPAGPEVGAADAEKDSAYRFEGWELYPEARRLVALDGQEVSLTAGEFDLLLALVTNPGRVLTRDRLLDLTKGRDWAAFDRSVDQQVGRLRRKIEADPGNPSLIKSVRGVGYVFASVVRRS